jgi:hypothetical protein
MEASVMARALGQRRKRSLVSADPAPQLPDAMKARHRPMQVPRAVVQVQTGPAGELVEIHVLAALTTSGAQEPRPPLHIQINWNPVPIDQNINRPCGEPV